MRPSFMRLARFTTFVQIRLAFIFPARLPGITRLCGLLTSLSRLLVPRDRLPLADHVARNGKAIIWIDDKPVSKECLQ